MSYIYSKKEFIFSMKLREQDILDMMAERLDRDPLVFGALHYPIGAYQDLSGEPYKEISEANPPLEPLFYYYW